WCAINWKPWNGPAVTARCVVHACRWCGSSRKDAMNWSETETETEIDAEVAPAATAPAAKANGALFLGDTGTLPAEARRALCQLLAGPSVDAQRQPAQWTALLRHEDAVRSL